MMYHYGAFDYYDSILCAGPHHVKEIRKYEELAGLANKKLIEAGYYRLERIYSRYQKYLAGKTNISEKTTVLIAPSWGDKNILASCGVRLVNLLLENGYRVIVRPHPETVRRCPKLINTLATKFRNNPEVTMERSVAADDSLLISDILICDCSGVALEYALGTERPVLFLEVPYKIKNDRFRELDIEPLELAIREKIGVIVSPEKIDTVPENIGKLIAEHKKYKEQIVQLRKQYVYAFGHSSEIGSKHIINLIQHETS
jgi:YidC/Oxa1 family membrane protein insertase